MRRARPAALLAMVFGGSCASPMAPAPALAAADGSDPAPRTTPAAAHAPAGPRSLAASDLALVGEATQGGFLRGRAPAGVVALALDGQPVSLAADGAFFLAFDRDAGAQAHLVATAGDGRALTIPLAVAPRAWAIEHVDVPRRPGGATEAFMKIREPELARIAAARAVDSDATGWRQRFVWPARGRISGRFGSQRIYRGGEAGSYHSGLDIATGGSGTVYVAPAEGVVVLAATSPFSLEGNLLIIDHGGGLNSAFLHSQRLYVKAGDRVVQGQRLGEIGMTGRATGPHLHWSLTWRGRRLDPLLFTGPMD